MSFVKLFWKVVSLLCNNSCKSSCELSAVQKETKYLKNVHQLSYEVSTADTEDKVWPDSFH